MNTEINALNNTFIRELNIAEIVQTSAGMQNNGDEPETTTPDKR